MKLDCNFRRYADWFNSECEKDETIIKCALTKNITCVGHDNCILYQLYFHSHITTNANDTIIQNKIHDHCHILTQEQINNYTENKQAKEKLTSNSMFEKCNIIITNRGTKKLFGERNKKIYSDRIIRIEQTHWVSGGNIYNRIEIFHLDEKVLKITNGNNWIDIYHPGEWEKHIDNIINI